MEGGLSVCDLITQHTLFAIDLNHHHKSLFPDSRERSPVQTPVAEFSLPCIVLVFTSRENELTGMDSAGLEFQ